MIFAIHPYFYPVENLELNTQELPVEFTDLLSKLKKIKKKEPLKISKIKPQRNDSIIIYHDSLVPQGHCDYINIDKQIRFSTIAFNKEQTIAAIIGSESTSCLSGHSSLYFLKKRNGGWEIIKVILLSIS